MRIAETLPASGAEADLYIVDDAAGTRHVAKYVYDFGDHWAHSVKLTRRIASPEGFHRRLLAGRRAGPPDDCGGNYGYDRLVELHRIGVDARDADSDGRAGWIVGGWTPDAFDLDAVKRNFDR